MPGVHDPSGISIQQDCLRPGSRVRLAPAAGGDVLDIALKGKTAIIQSIERDFEDQLYLAVVLEDDPGKDLGYRGQIGHRFFFRPQEVQPLDEGGASP